MTVCVAVKVQDCIVFAADSASSTSIAPPDGVPVAEEVWKHDLKVINLHRDLPIMAMTAGLGNFGSMSISNLTKEFRIQLMKKINKKNYTIKEVVDSAQQYFQLKHKESRARPDPHHSFEFWIGGYGHENKHGEIWKINIHNGQILNPVQLVGPMSSQSGVQWGGQVRAIQRLILGYDQSLWSILKEQVSDENQLRSISLKLQEHHTPLVHHLMSVQDAIDLAYFLMDMTKQYLAFLPEADFVGGDTDIATITKHEGFKWIRRKHCYPNSTGGQQIMPNERKDSKTVIRDSLIRETVMPRYEFQKHQYGFGSIGGDQPAAKEKNLKGPFATTKSES